MKIHNGEILPQENTSGTITYLQMAWRYVEIFYSLELSLRERIQCASYVCNFLRIWRLWVYRTGSLTLQHNFVSRETFQDVCLSCHHVVLFIKASRDFAPTQAICLERLGTDVCEEYFSSNGSFVLNKHNYTITDMFRNLCNMQRLQEIYADSSGPDNPKKHRKGENIWMKGHRKPAFPADLHDFPSDEEMAKAWEMGLREAQQKLREMGITPQDDDESNDGNNWYFRPHKIDSTTDAGIFAQMWTDHENVGNVCEGMMLEAEDRHEEPPPICDNNMEANYVDQYPELASYLRQMSDCDSFEAESTTTGSQANSHSLFIGSKVALTVKVPNIGEVHKSTIFSMLNISPGGISTDRLKRVKSKIPLDLGQKEKEIRNNEVSLFDDVAIHVKEASSSSYFKIGRILRMRNRNKSIVQFRKPVSLGNTEKYPNLYILVNLYVKDNATEYSYNDKSSSHEEFSFNSIIMKVTLELHDSGKFTLSTNDTKVLDDFVKNVSKGKAKKRSVASISGTPSNLRTNNQTHCTSATDGEGRVVICVEGQVSDSTSVRKSSRTRKVVIYEGE